MDEKIFRSQFVQNCIRKLGAGVSLDWVKGDIWGRDLEELKSKFKTRYSKLALHYTDINDTLRHTLHDDYMASLRRQMPKIKRKTKEGRLKAQAAQTAEQQRSFADTFRNPDNFQKQLSVYPRCPFCSKDFKTKKLTSAVHLDHIYPVSKGGHSVADNLVFICSDCNAAKSDTTLAKFCHEADYDHRVVVERLLNLDKDV